MHFSVFLALFALTGPLIVQGGEVPADKDVIVFPAKLGDVTFHHKLHSGLTNVGGVDKVECNTCHHTYQGDGAIKACNECHIREKSNDPESPPDLKKAFHYRCRGCHKYTMEEGKTAGPDKKCKLCHVK
jgi:hypothetical protein